VLVVVVVEAVVVLVVIGGSAVVVAVIAVDEGAGEHAARLSATKTTATLLTR
jgi:hypothetical protein